MLTKSGIDRSIWSAVAEKTYDARGQSKPRHPLPGRQADRDRAGGAAWRLGIGQIFLAFTTWNCSPIRLAAVFTSPTMVSTRIGSAGLTSTAIRVAAGNSSRRRPSRFAANSAVKKLMPVALPAGRASLATRPSLTGSSPTPKTMGIVVVAALAARAAGVVPRRSLIPGGGPDRPPTPEIDCSGLLPIGTRSQRSGPERNRSHQGLG